MKPISRSSSIRGATVAKCLLAALAVCGVETTLSQGASANSTSVASTSVTSDSTPAANPAVASDDSTPVIISQVSPEDDALPVLPSSSVPAVPSVSSTSSLAVPTAVPPVSPASASPAVTPAVTAAAPGSITGWESNYVLGAGDEISVEVYGAPEYGGDFTLLPDGTISLPVTGQIALGGLTLAGASDVIAQRYAPYLRSPSISLSPTTLRPLQVGVVGAVERPGTYTVPVQNNGTVAFPRLTDALRLAGGVSSRADIREIEIYRPDRFGQAQVLRVNLFSLLQDGNISGDVVLRSGDTISIPIATALTPAEAAQIGEANFSPEAVTVYVVGEVDRPGPVQVTPNTPLNQVLLAAGGFDTQRADNDEVGLIRLNADGSVEERSVAVDLSDGANEETNPLLREDDVIVVDRSGLATFSDTVGLAVNPIGRLLSTFFNIFNFLD